jgi:hypothetical protein
MDASLKRSEGGGGKVTSEVTCSLFIFCNSPDV